jgi:hypothetical protein
VEGHERRCHKVAVLGLEEAVDRLADRDNECADVENANHTSCKALRLADVGLQVVLRRLRGNPTAGRMADEKDLLAGFH